MSAMSMPVPEEQPDDGEPTQKVKWYWHVLSWGLFAFTFVVFGGVRVLFLQDIPVLLFLVAFSGLIALPFNQWFGLRLKSWSGMLLGFMWIAGIGVGMYALLLFVIPPFAISPETTYLTEPRAKEFYGIDYQAVIKKELDPGVPLENNGFRLLIATFCRSLCKGVVGFNDKHWEQLCQYLDLPVEFEPELMFVRWWQYEKTLEPEKKELVKMTPYGDFITPYSEEAIPLVRQWFDENEAALDVFVAAIQMPAMHVPPMFNKTVNDTIGINEEICREIVRNLQIRVRYRMTIGEIDEAWNDVLALYHIVEHHRKAVWNTLSSIISSPLQRMANGCAESVLIHSGWTSDEIRKKAEKIAPFLKPVSEDKLKLIFRNERLTALDTMRHLLRDEDEILNPGFWDWFKQKNNDANIRRGYAMVEINRHFDKMERHLFHGEPEPNDMMEEFNTIKMIVWYGTFAGVPTAIGWMMSSLCDPTLIAWWVNQKSNQAEISLTHLVFALEAYRRDKGDYPDELNALRGDYIAEIPLDPFTGKSFRYIVNEDAPGYLLYSVGQNGIDDGGRNTSDEPKGDDIRRRVPIVSI
jgi:hypothetical protein